jgi:sugar lactone lactonase YvrE
MKTEKVIVAVGSILIGAMAVAAPWTKGPEANRPALFKTFGDIVNTPEGLALDKDGNLFLSAINGVDPSYSGHIWKATPTANCQLPSTSYTWSVFAVTRTNTNSGKSFPQGIVFGDDGHLYYAENQYFANRNYASTVRRIVIKDGEPQRCETVVEHVMLPNGLRWRDGALYFSESFAHHGGKFGGALYRIPAADLRADKPARLLDKGRMDQDPYCLGFVPTRLFSRNGIDPLDNKVHIYTAGPDGIDFDADGNLYTGSFGDGRFWRLKALGGGKFGQPELLDDKTMVCCDGIVYDAKHNRILCTAAAQNAIYAWDVAKCQMELVWANGDNDGAMGLLDQPSELIYLPDGRLVVVNIDAPSAGMVNSGADKIHTLSVIK